MTLQPNSDRQILRQTLRAKRRELAPREQLHAAHSVAKLLLQQPKIIRAKHIALYWPSDGEVDLRALAQQLWAMNKKTYLPVLHPSQARQLWFVEFDASTELIPNRFGIPEPDAQTQHKMPAHLLDVVLVPLVGFDRTGARIGMGGGFYDASFEFLKTKPGKPFMVGIAHHCQEVEAIETERWDISLQAIVTDKEWISAGD